MAIEIERKFLVISEAWRACATAQRLQQGYLAVTPDVSVRVRCRDGTALLTMKSSRASLSRAEFEYEIPPADAAELLATLCTGVVIDKIRHSLSFSGQNWVVDEYLGVLSGLLIAEIELATEDQSIVLPPWVAEEVTGDPRYLNSSLSLKGKPDTPLETEGDQ